MVYEHVLDNLSVEHSCSSARKCELLGSFHLLLVNIRFSHVLLLDFWGMRMFLEEWFSWERRVFVCRGFHSKRPGLRRIPSGRCPLWLLTLLLQVLLSSFVEMSQWFLVGQWCFLFCCRVLPKILKFLSVNIWNESYYATVVVRPRKWLWTTLWCNLLQWKTVLFHIVSSGPMF